MEIAETIEAVHTSNLINRTIKHRKKLCILSECKICLKYVALLHVYTNAKINK